ncbi:hypothetical protein A3Q56_01809 [Intoshia linei]|uniref:small monomeric GTPase n=1 Tax=Intoshia linei TaxID=1819745 RepID=A0A177BA66_9BILA|nr:hypothetical protein A3Q56_01809 [Intoshia linei]
MVNIMILGDKNVGKTAFCVKYMTGRFIHEYCNFDEIYNKCEETNEIYQINLKESWIKTYNENEFCFNWTHIYAVLYTITNKETFKNALVIIRKISQYSIKMKCENDMIQKTILLIGNKIDLEIFRDISKKVSNSVIKKYPECCSHIEISVAYASASQLSNLLMVGVKDYIKQRNISQCSYTSNENNTLSAKSRNRKKETNDDNQGTLKKYTMQDIKKIRKLNMSIEPIEKPYTEIKKF